MRLEELIAHVAFIFNTAVHANRIGYFWHLTDLHWDPNYETKEHNCLRTGAAARGRWGDHGCDSPWALVDSAAQAMLAINDDVEFILWTGDGVTNSKNVDKMAALTNLTHLLSHTFSSHFVFPVLGHDDPLLGGGGQGEGSGEAYRSLATLWKHWLPTEALATFNTGGYYTIERKRTRLRLVALNTNLCTGGGSGGAEEEEDPGGQWAWLESVLANAKAKHETVYLVGHTPPGVDERTGSPSKNPLTPHHNARYVSLVSRYSEVITGQFFGHLHSDTFRLIYNDTGAPVSRLFVAPSVTPRRSSAGLNNPGVRLYKIYIDTGQVMDYTQYYLDLPSANRGKEGAEEGEGARWQPLYNLTDYYDLADSLPQELHTLAETFTAVEGLANFTRYLEVNSVASSSPAITPALAHSHYCAVTRLDFAEFQNCVSAAPAPLAATTPPTTTSLAPRIAAPERHALLISLIIFLAMR